MKFVGKVTERMEGSSIQVRISGTLDLSTGDSAQKPQPVELIISTQSDAVFHAFSKGQEVSFEL